MIRDWNGFREKGGFSLTEMLFVVLIITILSALSFPPLISIRNHLRQTELDGKAREIFMAAQNQMAMMRLRGVEVTDGEELEGKEDSDSYVDSGKDSFSWMDGTAFSPMSVAANGGRYVIEYSKKARTVNGVFYWEPEGTLFQKGSGFSYPQDADFQSPGRSRAAVFQEDDDGHDRRMALSVGYYGGDAGTAVEQKDLDFQVTVWNRDKLQVMVACTGPGLEAVSTYKSAVFEVALSSATDHENQSEYHFRLEGGQVREWPGQWGGIGKNGIVTAVPAQNAYMFTLDSLEEGLHFADHFQEIAPGDDVRMTVTAYGRGDSKVYLPQVQIVDVNSLFGGLRGKDNQESQVSLENGRHLQNLAYEVSRLGEYVDGDGRRVRSPYPVRSALMTEDIDWALAGREGFCPISNVCDGGRTELMKFDGNYKTIDNLHVSKGVEIAGQKYMGMFGRMEGGPEDEGAQAVIQNLSLVNPLIDSEGEGLSETGGYAGALAAYISNARLEGCGVWIEGMRKEGQSYFEEGKEPWILYENGRTGVLAEDYGTAGGLIGFGSDLSADSSFASVKVTGGGLAGGFAGELSGDYQVFQCYCGGHTENGNYNAQRPNIVSGGNAGGFVGILSGNGGENSRIGYSFSTCSVQGGAGLVGSFSGGFREGESPDQVLFENTYGAGQVFQPDGTGILESGFGQEPTEGVSGEMGSCDMSHEDTHAYDNYLENEEAAYPYPSWTEEYYGDWAQEETSMNSENVMTASPAEP